MDFEHEVEQDTREIGDVLDDALAEIERLRAQLAESKRELDIEKLLVAKSGEPVGEIVLARDAVFFPKDEGFFTPYKSGLKLGAKLYTAPQPVGIPEAMAVLRKAMRDDPEYAFGWHSNIAMACCDSLPRSEKIDHLGALEIGNEAASRFMKLCFDATTSQDMLSTQGGE